MPRKLYRVETGETPEQRLGGGAADQPSARKKAQESLSRKRARTSGMQEVVDIMGLPDVEEDTVEEVAEEAVERRQAGHQARVRELIEDTQREEAAKHEGVMENVRELQAIEAERMQGEHREKVRGLRKQAGEMVTSLLHQERDDVKQRMEEMGGVWGGESYFLLNDRLQEIEGELAKLEGRPVEKKMPKVEAPLPATEEALVMGELTPEDRIADAHKTIKFIEDSRAEIEARQKDVMNQLKKHGFRTPADIQDALADMEPEIRAESMGVKPSWGYRLSKIGRNLMGLERPPEAKALLKEYVDLESQANAQLHMRNEAEADLLAAEAAAGRPRKRTKVSLATIRSAERPTEGMLGAAGDMSGFAKTFTEAPESYAGQIHLEQELQSLKDIEEGSVGKEKAAIRALKAFEEEIQDSMMNLALKKDEFGPEDMELYTDKLDGLNKRLSALYDQTGTSPAEVKALKMAEESLAQYRRQVSQASSAIVGQARTAGKGEARPASVIGMRAGTKGTYGTSQADRRMVQLSKLETQDVREQREAQEKRMGGPEKVDKMVEVYRNEKWRKDLIDKINDREEIRKPMHALYEAFKKRVVALQNEGQADLLPLYESPDPALDYALNLYRLQARKVNGAYRYSKEIRDAARTELESTKYGLLGEGWDGGTIDQIWKEMSGNVPKVMVDMEAYKAEAKKTEEEEMEIQDSDIIEDMTPKKAANEKPAVIVSRIKPVGERPRLELASEEEKARIDREAEESFAASLKDTTPEKPLPHVKRAMSEREQEAAEEELSGFKPAGEVLGAEEVKKEEENPEERLQEEGFDRRRLLSKSQRDRVIRNLHAMADAAREGTEARVAELIANPKYSDKGWIDSYVDMYNDARALPDNAARKDVRERLEEVNKLLGIERSVDLLEDRREASRPERPRMEQRKPKAQAPAQLRQPAARPAQPAAARPPQPAPKPKAPPAAAQPQGPGKVMTMTQVLADIEKNKAQPVAPVIDMDAARRRAEERNRAKKNKQGKRR